MKLTKRNCVFVALSNAVGHELVFRHYTNKVVVGKHPDRKENQVLKAPKNTERKKRA